MKRMMTAFLLLALLASACHAEGLRTPEYSKEISVPGAGTFTYYAQVDPAWEKLAYCVRGMEGTRYMGMTGCCPTALAMVLANLLDDEGIQRLIDNTKDGAGFVCCPCSVNRYHCGQKHQKIALNDVSRVREYLPVCVADFLTGNNAQSEAEPNSNVGFWLAARICGLSLDLTQDIRIALQGLDEGGLVLCSTTGGPFAKGGHYMVITGYDDTYFYIADPMMRENYYETDRGRNLKVVEPGLVAARREKYPWLDLGDFFIFRKKDPGEF